VSFTVCGVVQTVKRNKQQYGLPLKIVSYEARNLVLVVTCWATTCCSMMKT